MPQGFVYILVSPNSNFIKIGGTERPISERLRGINGTESYSDHGPWELSDFLHVTDWRLVEGEMHRHFQQIFDAKRKVLRFYVASEIHASTG
jgi:T5orf172 domain